MRFDCTLEPGIVQPEGSFIFIRPLPFGLRPPSASMVDMLCQALDNHKQAIEEITSANRVADAEGDPGSSDLFARALVIHEKRAWFLNEILKKQDGLVA